MLHDFKTTNGLLIAATLLFAFNADADPVNLSQAQMVAGNFYYRTFTCPLTQMNLAYTEADTSGNVLYYVFNVIPDKGFVIVSAEDATHPILGYSGKGKYELPKNNNNHAWWMNCRKKEIAYARANNLVSSSAISAEWADYLNNSANPGNAAKMKQIPSTLSSINPLLSTAWSQAPYYNALCPGGSLAGCTAVAMAQIMRYWQYPSHGQHDSVFYWDLQALGFQENYGYLKANFDTTNYLWSDMPPSVSGPNYPVARLMYDCALSVETDFSQGSSGAWVLTGDYPLCSQNAYVKYFGYNSSTMQGLYEGDYTLTNWTTLLENELINKRPVQYAGFDSADGYAGHTWVIDGYDASTGNFDMNWGWGGSDDGYYSLSALSSDYDRPYDWWCEAIIGIQPPPSSPWFTASGVFGCSNLSVNFQDWSIADSGITSRLWLFPGGNPIQSPSLNPSVVYSNPGTYDVSEIVSSKNGRDTLVRKAYISVALAASLPQAQDFQSGVFPPAGWVINNPQDYSYSWHLNTATGGYAASSQCMYFNNAQANDWNNDSVGLWIKPTGKAAYDVIGQRQQVYTPEFNFTKAVNPLIYFDVAYSPYNETFSDTLAIYYSVDCGSTFNRIYLKGGMTLCSTGNTVLTGAPLNAQGVFTPKGNNWRTDTVRLEAIAGAPSVIFSFENRSGNGSPIYIDNITIMDSSAVTGIKNQASSLSYEAYPNPVHEQLNLKFDFNAAVSTEANMKIMDINGKEIMNMREPIRPNQVLTMDVSSLIPGEYIVRLIQGNSITEIRFIKQ